jgi:signal transduction histidine kinase
VSQTAPLSQVLADGPDVRVATAERVMTPAGRILARSGGTSPALPTAFLRDLSGPTFTQVTSKAGAMRLYLLPVNEGQPLVVVVGSALTGLDKTMGSLELLLLLGDPAGLALASVVAFVVTGSALRPVERMRREADAISVTDLAKRLPVPGTHDEVGRLGETLNSLLDRLQAGVDRERRLLDDASHELRTPLSALKAELDLALSRARPAAELELALRSASEETNRLARLAQDLLVLSRSRDGGLAIHRVDMALGELLRRACARHQRRAAAADCRIECQVADTTILADPMKITQAIDNLLDNAVRYSGDGGIITVRAEIEASTATIAITNPGPGFSPQIVDRAFEPFVSDAQSGAGLGLAIVQAVARAHGGQATAGNVPGGARVAMTLMRDPARAFERGQTESVPVAAAAQQPATR